MVGSDAPSTSQAACTAEDLFDAVWEAMVDVLGSAATATLVRKGLKRAIGHTEGLHGLAIRREGFEYSYTLPPQWKENRPEFVTALRGLARELSPLLHELTGPIVIRRLNTLPELRRCELSFQEGGDEQATDPVGEHR